MNIDPAKILAAAKRMDAKRAQAIAAGKNLLADQQEVTPDLTKRTRHSSGLPSDGSLRKTVRTTGKSCTGFSNPHFLNQS